MRVALVERNRMKIMIGMILTLLAVGAQPAAAAAWRDFGGGRFDIQAQRQRPGDFQRPPQRDFRRDERPPEGTRNGSGRLSDDERRNLRRDIDRANREIYKKQRPSR